MSLSTEDLRDLADVCRQPLTDKVVLVPLGRKAFFEGKLQPTTTDAGEEQLFVRRTDGQLEKMERKAAVKFFESERATMLPKKAKPLKPALKSALKPSKVKKTVVDSKPAPAVAAQPTIIESNGPFFEIREDEDGKGEVIDMTKQLENWDGIAGQDSKRENDVHTTAREEVVDDGGTLKKLSDGEYAALTMRLEELERKEEEAEKQKTSNAKSAKKLQSKGWSTGFLNSKPTPRKPVPKPAPPTAKPPPATNATEPRQEKGKTVGFSKSDDVQEIPRIGERSVRQTRPSNPFPQTVVSDTVTERPMLGEVVERPRPAPKKRVSRFAQERRARD